VVYFSGFLPFHTWYMYCPCNPPRFACSNNIWWRVQIMKLPIKQIPPSCSYFLPCLRKYSFHCTISKLSLYSSLNVRNQASYPYKIKNKTVQNGRNCTKLLSQWRRVPILQLIAVFWLHHPNNIWWTSGGEWKLRNLRAFAWFFWLGSYCMQK
jgi:hypothetical protein